MKLALESGGTGWRVPHTHLSFSQITRTLNTCAQLNAWIPGRPDGHYSSPVFTSPSPTDLAPRTLKLMLSRQTESVEYSSPVENIIPEKILLAPVQWDIMTEITHANRQTQPPPECPADLVFVPESFRQPLLNQVHTSPSSGHPGITATEHLLRNRFWWPTLLTDVAKFIHDCTICSTTKSLRQLPAGLLQPLPTPHRPWSHIAIDFITDLPNSQGNTTILTIVDRFSKACRLIPLPKLPTSLETAELLCNQVFRYYGLPDDIVSDRGPQFTSRVWSAFFKSLNVNISLTSGYHPQSNGQTERLNQEVIRFLRSYCQQQQTEWSRYLMWAEYAQNSWPNQPQAWPLSNVSSDSSHQCSPGPENPPNYLRLRNGCNAVKKSGTELTPISSGQSGVRNFRLTDIDDQVPSTSQGNGSGSRPEIFASDFHARNSVPGMLDPSKFPDKSPLYHFG